VRRYEREYAPSTPSWVDLSSPDLVVSARFYGGLFGWETATRGPAELTRGYLTFQLDGRDVAGLAPLTGDDVPSWTTYIGVEDAEATEATVLANAGTTLVAPTDVGEAGRMAVFTDPTGAVFAVWQPEAYGGAEVIDEAGAVCWSQLATRHVELSKRFYGAVFDWLTIPDPGEMPTTTRFRRHDSDVAGMVEMDGSWPRDLPSHWMTFFAVDDCEEVAERAVELGGDIAVEPYEMPDMGLAAVLGDPHGAVFSVLTKAPTMAPVRQ
jgi:predicted enzyme related to lactoylglutathione lyase